MKTAEGAAADAAAAAAAGQTSAMEETLRWQN
jgi:hypothetical protein